MPKVSCCLPQPFLHKVFELNLVRAGLQRNLDLAQKRVGLGPVIDHDLLVDIQPVAAVLSRALNESQVVARQWLA